MINVWIALRNPFKAQPFRAVWSYEKQLTSNKSLELQISRYAFNWLEVQIDLNWRQTDHAGPWVMLNLFGWQFDVRIYDRRHWNDETDTWGY